MVGHWRQAATGVGCTAMMLFGAACGNEGDEREGTQPAPDVSSFEQGRFDDLPLFPRSDPFGPRSEKEGIVARTYRARGVAPEGIIEFYREELAAAGWDEVEPEFRADSDTRADWVIDDWRLEVSAKSIPDNRESSVAAIQYSLVLRPQ